jgi:hypothetical protein
MSDNKTSDQTADAFWGEIAPCNDLVRYYEDDRALLEILHDFILSGLQTEECAVVIATPAHREELDKRLKASGLDIEATKADNQYIVLDAEETLSKFMVNDWPADEKFAKVITDILFQASSRGRRARVFSEMVAMLWAKGYSGATVHLEHIWNNLHRAEGFSVFCAYPKSGITKKPSQSITEIRAVHSKILSDSQTRILAVQNKITEEA